MTNCNSCDPATQPILSANMQDLVDEVMLSLGGTLVDVELCPSDIVTCFKKAKRKFIQMGHNTYRREFMVLEVKKTDLEYDIPEDVDTVIRIVKPSTSWSTEDAFSMVAYNSMFNDIMGNGGCSRNGIDFLSYEFAMGRIETLKRMGAYYMQFRHDKFRNKLHFMKKPEINGRWLVECTVNLADDEYAQIDWIIRWTIAEAKNLLGIAYRKFGSLPSPTGETSLNGDAYIQESKEEKEALLKEIEDFVDGESDYMEITFG